MIVRYTDEKLGGWDLLMVTWSTGCLNIYETDPLGGCDLWKFPARYLFRWRYWSLHLFAFNFFQQSSIICLKHSHFLFFSKTLSRGLQLTIKALSLKGTKEDTHSSEPQLVLWPMPPSYESNLSFHLSFFIRFACGVLKSWLPWTTGAAAGDCERIFGNIKN